MANIIEQQLYEAAVYELATTDPVMGGTGGVDNLPHLQLTNRTAWLKQQVDALIAAGGSAAAITASINAHLAAVDPHPTYTTNAEVQALIDGRALLRANMPQGLRRVATQLPNNYALQTWSDGLEDGHYDLYLSVAQNGLSSGFWSIDVQRHSSDVVSNQYRTITAKSLGVGGSATNEIYTSTCTLGVWTRFVKTPSMDAFGSSLAQNGYQQLPSGLIMQWGITSPIPWQGNQIVLFPMSFLNHVGSVVICPASASSLGAQMQDYVTSVSVSSFTVFHNGSITAPIFWQAIGY